MFDDVRADLRRYARRRSDCRSTAAYFAQLLPVLLLHEGAICMVAHRAAAWLCRRRLRPLAYLVSKVAFFCTGNYVHHETRIGPGCKLNHGGVVIHAVRIGRGFECSADVTVGQKVPYRSPYPVIGDYVMVGAGARVLSDVGDEVIVGANCVVIEPVPSGMVVVGVPARAVGSSREPMALYKSYVDGGGGQG